MKELIKIGIETDRVTLEGELEWAEDSRGLVIFSHGSGSSRLSPRNNYVAKFLRENGMATFLFDLLTAEEDKHYYLRFDIGMLAARLTAVTRYLITLPSTQSLAVGYFGASTGAASAIVAASILSDQVKAVVARGGRPDLAADYLQALRAPTLLIVGGHDREVITLNREALQKIRCEKSLQILEGATHLFEEPGMLEEVARLSSNWFTKYLSGDMPVKRQKMKDTLYI